MYYRIIIIRSLRKISWVWLIFPYYVWLKKWIISFNYRILKGENLMYWDRIISTEFIRTPINFSQIIIKLFFVFSNVVGHRALNSITCYTSKTHCYALIQDPALLFDSTIVDSAKVFKVSLDFTSISPLHLLVSHAT